MTPTKSTKTEYIDFPITIGIRIRLQPEQKQLIKQRFDEISAAQTAPDSIGRGGLVVHTHMNPVQLIQAMGCDRYTLSSLLATNERLTVGQLQKWESALDIKLVDKKSLEDAWKGYIKHLGV